MIEVGARDAGLAAELRALGCHRYLGLVPPDQVEQVRRAAPDLADRIQPLLSSEQGLHNNAELLVLRAPFGRLLWAVWSLRHVTHVLVEAAPRSPEWRLAAAVGLAGRRMRRRGWLVSGGSRFAVLEMTRRPELGARRHLSPVWGVPGLAARLEQAGIRYAVLRWFEQLPVIEPGEDLDVLVADADLPALHALLDEEPGTIPVDVYSETGLPGSDFNAVAYYPPPLARRLLERAVTHSSGVRVPAPADHLRSLAFHAAYHKGARSGLPSEHVPEAARVRDPEHDYADALRRLAADVGVSLPETLEGLDDWLAAEGWQPPRDTMRRLAQHNPWLRSRLGRPPATHREPPEVSVFLVRERALSVVSRSEVEGVLDHFGFEVVLARELDEQARARCAAHLRGGNWGRGPFPVSGGGPALVLVAAHHGPVPPDKALLRAQPRLSNLAVFHAKCAVRDLVEERLDPDQRFNAMHSSDDEDEAWEYVEVALPDDAAALRAAVEGRRADYRTDVPVRRVLSLGRRAKVEVVDGPDGPVVRKTFAAAFRRHLDRELLAFTELAPHVPAVPTLLETGPTWFSVPLYDDQLSRLWKGRRLVPLRVVREMVEVLRSVHAQGFDLVDARPQNFLVDPRKGMKVLDFEFLHRYGADRPDFVDSYCFTGLPAGWTGDVPVGRLDYDEQWRWRTGMSRHVLVAGPRWRQHLERLLFRLSPTSDPSAPALRGLRLGRRVAGHAAREAVQRYAGRAERRALKEPGGVRR